MLTKVKYAIFLFIFLLSCNKYKYSKPCTVNFTTEFVSSDPASGQNATMNLTIDRLTFSGQRTKAIAVEIEKQLAGVNYELKDQLAWGLDMDIPIGTYESYTLKMRLSPNKSFKLVRKNYKNFLTPIIVNFDSDVDLPFNASEISPELKKNKNYTITLQFNLDAVFLGISDQDLENASNPGNGAIVINENNNSDLLQIIKGNLSEAVSVKIHE